MSGPFGSYASHPGRDERRSGGPPPMTQGGSNFNAPYYNNSNPPPHPPPAANGGGSAPPNVAALLQTLAGLPRAPPASTIGSGNPSPAMSNFPQQSYSAGGPPPPPPNASNFNAPYQAPPPADYQGYDPAGNQGMGNHYDNRYQGGRPNEYAMPPPPPPSYGAPSGMPGRPPNDRYAAYEPAQMAAPARFEGDRYNRYDHPEPPRGGPGGYGQPEPYGRDTDRYARYERHDAPGGYDGRGAPATRGFHGRSRSRSPQRYSGGYERHSYDREGGFSSHERPPFQGSFRGGYDGFRGGSRGRGGPRGRGGERFGRGGHGGYDGGRGRIVDPEEERIRRETSSIFIGNLPDHFDEAVLRAAFEVVAPVTSCAVPTDSRTGESRRFGFVTYGTRADAEAAMRHFSTTPVEDRFLRLDWDIGTTSQRAARRPTRGSRPYSSSHRSSDSSYRRRDYSPRYSHHGSGGGRDDDNHRGMASPSHHSAQAESPAIGHKDEFGRDISAEEDAMPSQHDHSPMPPASSHPPAQLQSNDEPAPPHVPSPFPPVTTTTAAVDTTPYADEAHEPTADNS